MSAASEHKSGGVRIIGGRTGPAKTGDLLITSLCEGEDGDCDDPSKDYADQRPKAKSFAELAARLTQEMIKKKISPDTLEWLGLKTALEFITSPFRHWLVDQGFIPEIEAANFEQELEKLLSDPVKFEEIVNKFGEYLQSEQFKKDCRINGKDCGHRRSTPESTSHSDTSADVVADAYSSSRFVFANVEATGPFATALPFVQPAERLV